MKLVDVGGQAGFADDPDGDHIANGIENFFGTNPELGEIAWVGKWRTLEPVWDFVLLLLASSGLYLSGMVFNDVFDRRIDAQDRSFPAHAVPSAWLH